MKADDVLEIIRHYRHDLLNELQLVHGYLSMGKTEKTGKKVQNMIERYHEERKLFDLHCPYFTLWLMSVDRNYPQFRIRYETADIGEISNMDLTLFSSCREIFSLIGDYIFKNHMYHGRLQIEQEDEMIRLSFAFHGSIQHPDQLKRELSARPYIQQAEIDEENLGFILEYQLR